MLHRQRRLSVGFYVKEVVLQHEMQLRQKQPVCVLVCLFVYVWAHECALVRQVKMVIIWCTGGNLVLSLKFSLLREFTPHSDQKQQRYRLKHLDPPLVSSAALNFLKGPELDGTQALAMLQCCNTARLLRFCVNKRSYCFVKKGIAIQSSTATLTQKDKLLGFFNSIFFLLANKTNYLSYKVPYGKTASQNFSSLTHEIATWDPLVRGAV